LRLTGLKHVEEVALDLITEKSHLSITKLNQTMDKLTKNTVNFAGAHNALKEPPKRIAFNHIPN
jgi:hypothetical protein